MQNKHFLKYENTHRALATSHSKMSQCSKISFPLQSDALASFCGFCQTVAVKFQTLTKMIEQRYGFDVI